VASRLVVFALTILVGCVRALRMGLLLVLAAWVAPDAVN
jgi:hypothetical protein